MTPPDSMRPLPLNRSIPPSTVIPVLAYADVRGAVAWLGRAFGFTERLQIADHRSQLAFGDGALVVAERGVGAAASDARQPGSMATTGATHSVMVRVPDVDAHHERARQAGARIVLPPADHPYGERQYTAEDPEGHRWTFTQTIADVDPQSWGGTPRG